MTKKPSFVKAFFTVFMISGSLGFVFGFMMSYSLYKAFVMFIFMGIIGEIIMMLFTIFKLPNHHNDNKNTEK